MAINEKLTDRIRDILVDVNKVEEKKMFSGIAFMVDGKLCIAVGNSRIMCRIDPSIQNESITKTGCSATIMKGKKLDGYVNIDDFALTTKKELSYWIKLALDYNPKAKASKKKAVKFKR